MGESKIGRQKMNIDPMTPILVGVGQSVNHWDGSDPTQAPSPLSLSIEAAQAALRDAGANRSVAEAIDTVVVVRTNQDSVPGATHRFGRCANPPATLAAAVGIAPRRAIYSKVGGDQPQALVNEFAEAIFNGQSQAAVLAGAEAIAAMKSAERSRLDLDWSTSEVAEMEDRGPGKRLLSAYELANGLSFPTQTYPAFEQALRARLGLSRDEHRQLMSELWTSFSAVAASNPYAQFPLARSASFLATPSVENYEIADPYLKWHVAQDAVNQGAALVLTSVGKARELGIDPRRWVYLHGYGQAADRFITERQDLSRSRAMELVLKRALESANRQASDIAFFDLYSCFPCAVLIAAEALGIDWRQSVPTVTGGLPFFGGAGNNYSMHAIASMVEKLRGAPGAYGLVLANGGYLSKEAAGVYSTTAVENWRPISSDDLQATIDAGPAPQLLTESVEAVVESYTVTFRKGQPNRGYVLARTDNGRILARARSGHRATLKALADVDPIGRVVRIEAEGGTNFLAPFDRLGDAPADGFFRRSFQFVKVERRGHVLEVALNRPERLNALHSAAHFELHEIWNEYERDEELWVAILTGAGDRAFCSGNDLKATARGADMSSPRSGFGGLCSRFDRTKPIIAAVNGVAMGGGMEIVLACDLAVSDARAKFALPEVKVGLFAAAGGVQRLTRQIARKAAMELILTGRHVSAAEAQALGVVNSVVAEGQVMAAARQLADRILDNSPSAVRASKEALNKLDEVEALQEALAASGPIFGRLMRTSDFKEGVTAFAEKRPPHWTNS
jgi:acetyl-CoA C-acetyltransferase